jgi:hypothetical protein
MEVLELSIMSSTLGDDWVRQLGWSRAKRSRQRYWGANSAAINRREVDNLKVGDGEKVTVQWWFVGWKGDMLTTHCLVRGGSPVVIMPHPPSNQSLIARPWSLKGPDHPFTACCPGCPPRGDREPREAHNTYCDGTGAIELQSPRPRGTPRWRTPDQGPLEHSNVSNR